jgi:hypothetical protein
LKEPKRSARTGPRSIDVHQLRVYSLIDTQLSSREAGSFFHPEQTLSAYRRTWPNVCIRATARRARNNRPGRFDGGQVNQRGLQLASLVSRL